MKLTSYVFLTGGVVEVKIKGGIGAEKGTLAKTAHGPISYRPPGAPLLEGGGVFIDSKK